MSCESTTVDLSLSAWPLVRMVSFCWAVGHAASSASETVLMRSASAREMTWQASERVRDGDGT